MMLGNVATAGGGLYGSFDGLDLATPQIIYYNASISGDGASNFNLGISDYWI